MAEFSPALQCEIDGQARLLPAAAVHLISLRIPVQQDADGAWADLDGERWPVIDGRERPAETSDHFVFLREGSKRRVVVVDRVVGLVDAQDVSASSWEELQ